MNPLNRRHFLGTSLFAAAHAASGATSSHPMPVFPADPRHRLAVASYPFRAMIDAPENKDRAAGISGMDLAGFARFIRSEFNVYGIEPLYSHFPSTEASAIRKLRADFDALGIRTRNIPIDETADLCSEDAAVRREGYAIYRKWVDIAVVLGAPSIRIPVPKCGGASDISGPAKALIAVVSYAASKGVIVNLENDDPTLASHTRIVAILARVKSPWFGALPDFANSLMGGDASFNTVAVRSMFSYVLNIVHVKDAESIEGSIRSISLPELFAIAKQAGYKGYYSMETDSNVDPVVDTKHLIEQSLALM